MDTRVSASGAFQRAYTFGDFTLDLDRGTLRRAGVDVRLRPKSFDVLCYLVENHGRVVSKDELLNAVWGRIVVTEGSITQCLIDIRRALEDRSQTIIRTIPRRGYIFDAPVSDEAGTPGVKAVSNGPRATVTPRAGGNRLAWVLAACVLVAIAGWLGMGIRALNAPVDTFEPIRHSIAVLPFADLSPEQDQAYLADGLAEDILDLLARVPALRVTARTSSFSFKGSNADIRTIAKKLDVTHVVEGTVRKSGDRVRVTAKLIDAATSAPVWSQTYDRRLEATLAVETEIATAVQQGLSVTLANLNKRNVRAPVNSEAFSLYLQGRFFHNRRAPGDLDRAVALYEEALRLDSRHARAWAGLSAAYRVKVGEGLMPRDAGSAKRRLAVEQALRLDPDLAEAHVEAARLALDGGDAAAAAEHRRKAVASQPDNPSVLTQSANAAAWSDRPDEAIVLARRVVALDPLAAVSRNHLAHLLVSAGRFAEARAEFIKQSELNPASAPETDVNVGFILILEHRFDEALASIERWAAGDDKDQAIAMIGAAVGREADGAAALQRLASTKQLAADARLAEVYAFRGDVEHAFHAMQAARGKITPDTWSSPDGVWILQLRFSAFLRPLHGDPRWTQLRPPPPAQVAAR